MSSSGPAPWEGRKVLVCVGTGGVGKTTVSATLGLACAAQGMRTLVMTIDPARRLADAMGLETTGNVESAVDPELLASLGFNAQAELRVMMPDVKRTFDDLIRRISPEPQRANRILENRVYHHFSTALAGSLEFAAVEKLHEVYTSGRYDMIILDTPPSQNVVDFLDAPSRILGFFEGESIQWVLKPYLLASKLSLRMFDFGSSWVLRSLGKVAGTETLRELAEFLSGFDGMYDAFRERATGVRTLLRSPDVGFVLVAAPRPSQSRLVADFQSRLSDAGMPIRAMVLNRVHPLAGEMPGSTQESALQALQGLPAASLEAWNTALAEETHLGRSHAAAIESLSEVVSGVPVTPLPELPATIQDMEALVALHGAF